MVSPLSLVSCAIPLFKQLTLEEWLLYEGSGSWCIVNRYPETALVLGIGSSLTKLVNIGKITAHPIPIIRRFSGGGAVVVDAGTLFFSLILDQVLTPDQLLMSVAHMLSPVFYPAQMMVCAQDFVIADRKIGGNAQAFSGSRSLQHTSFLWQISQDHLSYLSLPDQQPAYRRARDHTCFCGQLSLLFPSPQLLYERLYEQLCRFFHVTCVPYDTLPHGLARKNSRLRYESIPTVNNI